jgi:hypothetical protein
VPAGAAIDLLVLGVFIALISPFLGFLNAATRRTLFAQDDVDEDDERFATILFAIAGLAMAGFSSYSLASS